MLSVKRSLISDVVKDARRRRVVLAISVYKRDPIRKMPVLL